MRHGLRSGRQRQRQIAFRPGAVMVLARDRQRQPPLPGSPGGVGQGEGQGQRSIQRRIDAHPVEADALVEQQIDRRPDADRVDLRRDHALAVLVLAFDQPPDDVVDRVAAARIGAIPGCADADEQGVFRAGSQRGAHVERERLEAALMLPDRLPVEPDRREVIHASEAQPGAGVATLRCGKRFAVEPRLLVDRPQMLAPVRPVGIQDGLQVGALRHAPPAGGAFFRQIGGLQGEGIDGPVAAESSHVRRGIERKHICLRQVVPRGQALMADGSRPMAGRSSLLPARPALYDKG